MRQCLFCDQQANSREHVWPDWILEALKTKQKVAVVGYMDELKLTLIGRKPELLAKFVCKTCNHGWMSQLESANKPLLGAFLRDITAPIDPVQQRSIAQWALKTAMVMGAVGSRKTAFYTQQERENLRTAFAIPPNTSVWLGRYTGRAELAFTGTHGWSTKPDDPKVIHAYVTTILFGRIAVQVFSAHAPDGHPSVVINARPGPWNGLLVRVWPAATRTIAWPPQLTFDERNAGLGDLCYRFKGEGSLSL